MKVFEIIFVQGVAHNFNIELIEIVDAEGTFEIWREGCFDQDRIVKLFDVDSYAKNRHGFEPAQRVAPFKEFLGITLVQGSGN